jgi:hypothetical protein
MGVAGKTTEVVDGFTSRALSRTLLECLSKAQGAPDPDVSALLTGLMAARLAAAPIVLVSTRTTSFQDALAARFHRPVAYLHAANLSVCDFYEGAGEHEA